MSKPCRNDPKSAKSIPPVFANHDAPAVGDRIGDVVATSDQEAGTVDIVFIMADGAKPGPEMINGLKGYLQDKTIRPMTDLVNVSAVPI